MTGTKTSMTIAVTLCSALLLASCSGSGGTKTAEQPISNPGDAQKVLQTPVELKFTYPGGGEQLFNQRFGDQIRKKFPNYTITFIPSDAKTFPDLISTNPGIDIMFTSATGLPVYLTGYKLESDISDLIKKYGYDLSRLEQGPLTVQRGLGNGAIYGLPWTIGTLVFLYNKDLFDKFGVPYPKDGMNWDEVYELARKMTRTESGVQYRGLTMAFDHIMGLNQLSAPYFDSKTFKAKFTDDSMKRLFDNAARFMKIPGNEPPEQKYALGTLRDLFQKSKTTAMHLDVIGVAQTTATAMTNWDFATFPVLKDNPDVGPSVLPEFAYITSMSKNRDAAFQVLAYLTSDEYQQWMAQTLSFLPVVKKSDEMMKTFGANIPGVSTKNVKAIVPKKFAEMQPLTPYYSVGAAEMTAAVNDHMADKDVNTALREAVERADKTISQMRSK